MIMINRPHLPRYERVNHYLQKTYANNQLTNDGPLVKELTERLQVLLGVDNLLLVANGTLAMQVAMRSLGVMGNVVTTPFSFVATTSSIVWEGGTPVFVDIDKDTLNLDPSWIVGQHKNVGAVCPVHVYGNPCDVNAIEAAAQELGSKVIYDAAHAFNVNKSGKSVLLSGDASILSFHATKLFHTVEGGAIRFKNRDDYNLAKSMISFGLSENKSSIDNLGINAKMSEFHAAMGLANLDEIDSILEKRVSLFEQYEKRLESIIKLPSWCSNSTKNGAYFAVLCDSTKARETIELGLSENGIQSRRYFAPALHTAKPFRHFNTNDLPIAESVSDRVLCLPMHNELSEQNVEYICEKLKAHV